MALFGKPKTPQDSRLVEILSESASPTDKDLKALAKNQDALKAAMGDDDLIALAATSNGILAVTLNRCLDVRFGAVDRELLISDIDHTEIASLTGSDTKVSVWSRKSVEEFAPDNAKRMRHVIMADVRSRDAGQLICRTIDNLLNQG
jgi:hypothetical protein